MEQTWLTSKIDYEGLPLYLRKPDYKNIWEFQDKFPLLLTVTHNFEKVTSNGIPQADYNETLIDFDGEMCDLLDKENEGLIFLIETYGGERNYHYFISDTIDYETKIKKVKERHTDIDIESHSRLDNDWGFLRQYPTKLF